MGLTWARREGTGSQWSLVSHLCSSHRRVLPRPLDEVLYLARPVIPTVVHCHGRDVEPGEEAHIACATDALDANGGRHGGTRPYAGIASRAERIATTEARARRSDRTPAIRLASFTHTRAVIGSGRRITRQASPSGEWLVDNSLALWSKTE